MQDTKITAEINGETGHIDVGVGGSLSILCFMAGCIIRSLLDRCDTPEQREEALNIIQMGSNAKRPNDETKEG